MSDDTFDISRRKILAGMSAVGVAGATAGIGTSAYFSDEESFENNTFTAGELDLKVDWQQRYWGVETTDADVYGDAGRPWVNAHPDHDDDGIQSLDSDQYDTVPDDGVVTYEDVGSNIQQYLSCETLDHDYGLEDRSLVELDDVKPGDSGEITFSYHLCDNPGYVWLCGDLVDAAEGGLTDPEADSSDEEEGVVELLDAINVQVWYDLDCDNSFADGERGVLAGSATTLRTFLNDLEEAEGNCHMLNAGVYPGIQSTYGCIDLDPIDFTRDGLAVGGDGNGEVVRVDEGVSGDSTDNLEVYVVLTDPDNDQFDRVVIRFYDMWTMSGRANDVDDLGDIIQFDWKRVDDDVVGDDDTTYVSDDIGMCELVLTDDTGSMTADLIGASCSTGEDDVVVPNNGGDVIRSAQFGYCTPEGGDPICFPPNRTFCLGFEWWVPGHVGNEIQSDSVSFDLGFYTEQCRHNDGTGPVIES